jgi:hypothetical protein
VGGSAEIDRYVLEIHALASKAGSERSRQRGEGAMNLIGSRATLIANVCALIAAFVVTAEDISDLKIHWDFFPAFVIHYQKSDIFFLLLALHVALLIQLFYQARSIDLVPSWRQT